MSDSKGVGVPLMIDIVAAVKEALHDVAIRDEIRAIVLERTSSPANDVEDLLDARGGGGISVDDTRRAPNGCLSGSIPCVRVGRRLRFRRADLIRR